MVGDVASTLVEGMRIKPLDRLGDADVQSLLAWDCYAGEERLTHKFMAEGKGPLRPFGTGDDDSHLLGFLDDDEKLVHVDLADLAQQLKTETAPDHRRRCQHPLLVLVQPLQAATDDQPDVFWNGNLVDRHVSAEVARRIEYSPFLV